MVDYYNKKCKCGCGRKLIVRKSHKRNYIPNYIIGHTWKNRHLSKKHKINVSKGMVGNINVKKTPEWIEKFSKPQRGITRPYASKFMKNAWKNNRSKWLRASRKGSKKLIGIQQTPEHIRKRLSRRVMSSLERKMLDIIIKNSLSYKFVGNGSFMIGNKSPDFICTDNSNICLEVYYRDHKNKFRNDIKKWESDRKKIFNVNGWKCIFFDETQVNDSYVTNKLR